MNFGRGGGNTQTHVSDRLKEESHSKAKHFMKYNPVGLLFV